MDLQAKIKPISELEERHENGVDMPTAVEDLEKRMLAEALEKTAGNKRKAARILGLTERILGCKVKQYNLAQ